MVCSLLNRCCNSLQWYEKFTDVDEVIPVSAKYGHGVEDVKEWILSKLPFGPPYYPKVHENVSALLLNYSPYYTRALVYNLPKVYMFFKCNNSIPLMSYGYLISRIL